MKTYWMRRLGVTATVLAAQLGLSAPAAQARVTPEAERLMRTRSVERYTVPTPKSSIDAGAARAHVAAPLELVRRTITDYGQYDKAIKKFDRVRIVGRHRDRTDVYLQVPVLRGVAKVWAIVRFEPPRKVKDGYVIRAHLVKGNIDRFDAEWRITKIDEKNTQLDLQLLVEPRIPAPKSLIASEVAGAAKKAIKGLRRQTEALYAKKR